jgi:hypothetical protein
MLAAKFTFLPRLSFRNVQKVPNPGINISCIQFVAGDTKKTCVQFVRSIIETAKQTKVGKIYVSFFVKLMKIYCKSVGFS